MPKFSIFKSLSKLKRSSSKSKELETPKESNSPRKESKASPQNSKKKIVVTEDPEVTRLNNITELFNQYAAGDDAMDTDAVLRFLEDLQLNPDDPKVIVLSWYFKAASQCVFTRTEFIQGFQALKVDSIPRLMEKISTFDADLKNANSFAEIYDFTFMWSRESPDKKTLDLETACDMLEVILQDKYSFCQPFKEFLITQTSYKSINRDQWNSFYEFCNTVNADLVGYDEDGSWPVLLDEFVVWLKEKSPAQYQDGEN